MLQGMEDVDKFTFRTQSNTKPVLINQTVNSLGKISTPFVGPGERTEMAPVKVFRFDRIK